MNLSKIGGYFLDAPKVTGTYTYNGSAQTIAFDSNFDTAKMEITGITRTGGNAFVAPSYTATTATITDAGEYEVTFKGTLLNPANTANTARWLFYDTGTETTKVKFTVNKYKLETPGMGTKSNTYTGETIIFTASNYITTSCTLFGSNPPPRALMSVAVTKTGGWGAGESASTNPINNRTVEIGVRNAGTYKATFTITETENYEWKDAGTKEIPFTVEKKKLSVAYTTDDPANPTLGWGADEATTATFVISGIYAGDGASVLADSVSLQAKISKDEDGTFSVTKQLTDKADGTQEFVLDASLFGGSYVPGHYPITFEFLGGTHDSNYDLTNVINTMSNEKFVVGASGAGLNHYDWKYSADGGTLTPMPAAGTNLVYAYNKTTGKGVEYRLTVDESSFAAANIELDTTYNSNGFVNGYLDNMKDRAGGPYTTKVRIKVTDPAQYAFSDGSTETDITYTWTIDKATIDTSSIKWQYTDMKGQTQVYDPTSDGIPWKGTNYTLTLSPLPDGVTVNPGNSYSGNQAKTVGNYTATCTSLSYDTNNYNTIATPTLNWVIKPQEIEINNTSWIMDQQTATTIFYLPHLNSPYDGTGILYEYWYLGEDGNLLATPEKLNDITEIQSDGGVVRNYYVKAYLSSSTSTDGVTAWDAALVLNDTTTQPNGLCTMAFTTGDNRAPVSVTLNNNPVMYDGKEHGKLNEDLFIRIGSTDMSTSDFHIDYYEYDDTQPNNMGAALTTPAPVDAGKYLIVVSLSDSAAADYFLNATTFEFEILPYEIDMSGVRWGYVDEDGNEVVYNPNMPPMYTLNADGTPKEITMQLVGFPRGDENGTDDEQLAYEMFTASGLEALISYTGNVQSAVGTYTAKYTLDETQLSSNFKLVSMPDPDTELKEEQGWKIAVREILGPQNNTATFSGDPYDLIELAGLNKDDLGVYFEIGTNGFITTDENNEPKVLDSSTVHGIVDAGVYRITLTLKDPSGDNIKWLVNGSQRTSAQVAVITINKLVVTVTDWEGEEGNQSEPWKPIYNNGINEDQPPAGLIENDIRDSRGETVVGSSWNTRWNETFKQKLKPTAGNENNIEIVYADGIDEEKSFTVGDDPSALPATPLTRPTYTGDGATEDGTGKELTFNGETQDFIPQGLQELVDKNRVTLYAVDEEGNETPVDIECFGQKNAGKYKVIVRISGNYKWSDTNDKSDAIYEFEVKKATVERPTYMGDGATADGTGKALTFNGEAQDFIPQGLQELVDGNCVTLYTVDGSGNETAAELSVLQQRNAGKYKIIVRLDENYKWSDTDDNSDAIYEFEVKKAKIGGTWGTDESGMPILTLADGTPEAFAGMLVFEYLDKDGNVVSADELTKGKEYTVRATVTEIERGNVTLITEDGEVTESLESTFTVPGRNTLANMIGLPEDFPLIQVILTILFTLLFIIFLILWIKYGKDRKASQEIIDQYEDLNVQ